MAEEKRAWNEVTPEIERLAEETYTASHVEPSLYEEYNVQRGLRDQNGKGVLVGITNISEVNAKREIDGKSIPIPGELFYRGYNVKDIVRGLAPDNHFDSRNVPISYYSESCQIRQSLESSFAYYQVIALSLRISFVMSL